MKNIRTILLCACTSLCSLFVSAQSNKVPVNEPDYNKPRLFDDLPSRIPVGIDDLKSIMNASAGQNASLKLSSDSPLQFNGEVVSVSTKYDNKIQSIVMRSANFNGATLTVSRIMNNDGSYKFTGRIISFQHGDLFELKNEAGSYVLVKKNYYELVNE